MAKEGGRPFAVVGTLVDSLPDWSLRLDPDGLLVVSSDGRILKRGSALIDLRDSLEEFSIDAESDLVRLSERDEFLMPGLIDAHTHAPQFPNCGLGLDLPLLPWLEQYTFPMEERFADMSFARLVYGHSVSSTLSCGTTTANYFATIHREASMELCRSAEERGQRALVGKVCMDRNELMPRYAERSAAESLQEARLFAASVLLERNSSLVSPVLAPRFALTCSMPLMLGLGELASELDLRVHSHLSENTSEVERVAEMFQGVGGSYAGVYAEAGLLTNKTTMAHGIHLSRDELLLLSESGTALAHCPNSNTSIRSGRLDVRRAARAGVKVGLGTDASAGYSPSMLDAMRQAVAVSTHVHLGDPGHRPLDFADAIYLATRGSAAAVALEEEIGCFEEGMQFDALRIRMGSPAGNPCSSLFGHESLKDLVHKFVFLADDRNIAQVWVQGRRVKDKDAAEWNETVDTLL